MRIEILRQMTDEELEYMSAYLYGYMDNMCYIIESGNLLEYSDYIKEDLERAKKDVEKVEQVQEERRNLKNKDEAVFYE